MQEFFYNEFGRLRSGWRFTFFIVAFVFVISLISPVIFFLLRILKINVESSSLLSRILVSSVGLVLAILLGWACGKLFEDLPFRALGTWFTKYWLKDLVLGILIGGISVGFAVLIAVTFGGLRFHYNEAAGSAAIQVTLLVSGIVFLFGAAFEEVLVRGYILQTFVRANLAWLAIILTSVFFAVGHLTNPNAELFSSINTGLAGIWLAIAYLKTRTLWLAFGIHFSWNWVMGAFFGIEVSGLTDLVNAPLLKEMDSGPSWITGGEYGLEGGIACTIALILSTALIWFLPFLKPTEEMVSLTSSEQPISKTI